MSITTPDHDIPGHDAPDHDTSGQLRPEDFRFARRAWIAATPARLYDLVSDVSMIGTWSPSASDVSYDDGAGPRAGAWFSGRNRRGGREWTTRAQVLRAEPGEEFAFVVDGLVRWRWTFRPLGTGAVRPEFFQWLKTTPYAAPICQHCEYLTGATAEDRAQMKKDLALLKTWLAA